MLRPLRLSILFLALALPGAPALAGQPSATPFPRIEAGQHTAPIWRIGVDAAGHWLVTASHDKTARVWDLQTGELLRVLRPPIEENQEGRLDAVALSPDGGTVAVGGWTQAGTGSHNIYLFDRQTGDLAHRIGGLPDVVKHLTFSPDGRRLAAALSAGKGIRVYRTGDWAEVWRDADYGSRSLWVAFDRAGRLASTEEQRRDGAGLVRLYGQDLGLIATAKAPGGQDPFGLAFSPDGRRIAVGFADSTAVNVLSGEDLSLLYAPDTAGAENGNLGRVAWSRDGRTLYAGGRYHDFRGFPLMSWPDAGRGPRRERTIAQNTIMDLVPLAGGGLVFGAQDPAWGLLDQAGERIRGRGLASADFRRRSHEIRLSDDGRVAEVDFEVLAPDGRWQTHVLRLDPAERRLTLDPGGDTEQLQQRLRGLDYAPGPVDEARGRRTGAALEAFQRERDLAVTGEPDGATRRALGLPLLTGPRTEAPGLRVTDWRNDTHPKLNGQVLDLERIETSFAVDVAEDASRFLLGTHMYLRLYGPAGGLIWKTSVPATTWRVNLNNDGRWAVAAFGDGSIRWFDAAEGAERLALFLDGEAIAKPGRGGGPFAPWVLWTPEGFFDAAAGGDRLMGWHLNRGADRAAELVNAEQIGEVFRRPDLVAQALEPAYPALAAAALAKIGDLRQLLAASKPPALERLGPAAVRQAGRDFEARFRLEDRGGGVGRIEYRVNGAVVGQGDFRGRFGLGLPNRQEESRPFTLGTGRHRIEARAFDEAGRVASPPLVWEVAVTGERRRPALYGLAVGIGPYRDQRLSLEYGDDDAQGFAAILNDEATTGRLFREVDVQPLVNERATLAGITTTFAALAQKAQPEDVFVLFLAGHGLAIDGRYYFIPWDLVYRNRKALEDGSLHEDRLRDLLAQVRSGKTLIVLDSCYSGSVVEGETLLASLRGGAALESNAAIDRLMATTGRAVLASSAARQFAVEGFEGHGVFTYVLLEGLRGRADLHGDRDGTVEISELADYLEDEVPRISLRVWQYEQFPMRNLQGQSFPIGLRAKTR